MTSVIELNVGGRTFSTSLSTLKKFPHSLLAQMFGDFTPLVKDKDGRIFIDRNSEIFGYILDYIRTEKLNLPASFEQYEALLCEAEYYNLNQLVEEIQTRIVRSGQGEKYMLKGYISLGVRGTYAFGRDGYADIKFRKLQRIIVSGNVALLRDAFGDNLNETRDTDRGADRYTSRFYLKHKHLEEAFDNLHQSGFVLVTSCAGGAGYDTESDETKWNHFANYIFSRV